MAKSRSNAKQSFYDAAVVTLRRRGMTMTDVDKWAWILSAQAVDEMAERFLSTKSTKPTFLLLEILRRDIQQVRILKSLLGYTWYQLLGTSRLNLMELPELEADAIQSSWAEEAHGPASLPTSVSLEDSTYVMIISRLLYQARRIWAPAMVSISHMVSLIIRSMSGSKGGGPTPLDPHMHHRLCKINNHALRLLALPASINPFQSMSHNWEAQRVLIEITEHFSPPLSLDNDSYRAVVQVLAASKKSERESRVASLRARSWPPWRIDQDGMDAQRSLEDDLSRVVVAITRSKESGYTESVEDHVSRILGGQEPDGTPTIQTRKLIKRRSLPVRREGHRDHEPVLWAARISATRDVQEAWSAFKNFEDQGGRASTGMYLAMFEKLYYNRVMSEDWVQYDALPGDGKEVFVPSSDNVSVFYQRRLLPPTFDELYDKMIESGHRPAGRLLTFLLEQAETIGAGLQYLRDSQVDPRATAFLAGNKEISPVVLKKIPGPTFAAFIALLCRFAPRSIIREEPPQDTDEANGSDHNAEQAQDKYEYQIFERENHPGEPALDPLLHCMGLLKESQTRFRPAWYAFFNALARRNVVIDRNLAGGPINDLLSWRVLFAALRDFHRCGLELDPQGFQIICRGIEKAVLASFDVSPADKFAAFAKSPVTVATDEFLKLSEIDEVESPYHTPKLLHSISGTHLHAYVRVLGLLEDHRGIIRLLKWMRRRRGTLEDIAIQSRNGPKLINRVFVATRVFLAGTRYEAEAERLVRRIERWGGWPEEFEAQKYLELWSAEQTTDEDVPEEMT
jgi:hypothetical protein